MNLNDLSRQFTLKKIKQKLAYKIDFKFRHVFLMQIRI